MAKHAFVNFMLSERDFCNELKLNFLLWFVWQVIKKWMCYIEIIILLYRQKKISTRRR